MDIAPATRPATPATRMLERVAWEVATPSIRLAVERMPSLAPNTAARSHPMRPMRCCSLTLDLRGISFCDIDASLDPVFAQQPDLDQLCKAHVGEHREYQDRPIHY